jgi:hypothetical protein
VDDQELARLLSGRDGPSVLEQEAGFERVLQKLDRGRAPLHWGFWLPITGAAAALAAVVLTLFAPEPASELAARGGGDRAPALQALCVESGAAGRCASGDRLAFVAEAEGYAYLALFARRSDGLVIWYFPSADGQSVPIADQAGKPLQLGAKLGEDQPPGSYELVGVFSRSPLTRAAIKRDLDDRLQSAAGHRVVRQALIVERTP